MRGSTVGSVGYATKSGCIGKEVFGNWLEHLKIFEVLPSENILLILDNRISHISVDAIDFARHNGIILCCSFIHQLLTDLSHLI